MLSERITGLSDRFKLGMRRHASNVCIIATVHEGRRHGMAATAVSSVCADPPTLLVCINRSASLHAPIRASGLFSVNVLSGEHLALARRFGGSGPREDRFADAAWREHDGWAYLQGASAAFLLRTETSVEHHSHSILVGRVEDVILGSGEAPLIYHDGRYASCSPLEVAA